MLRQLVHFEAASKSLILTASFGFRHPETLATPSTPLYARGCDIIQAEHFVRQQSRHRSLNKRTEELIDAALDAQNCSDRDSDDISSDDN